MLKFLFQSLTKSRRLRKVSKDLSESFKIDFSNFAAQGARENKCLDQLFDICQSDESVNAVMSHYRVDKAIIKNLYSNPARIGAGQYAGGHYVAASGLVYASTLGGDPK